MPAVDRPAGRRGARRLHRSWRRGVVLAAVLVAACTSGAPSDDPLPSAAPDTLAPTTAASTTVAPSDPTGSDVPVTPGTAAATPTPSPTPTPTPVLGHDIPGGLGTVVVGDDRAAMAGDCVAAGVQVPGEVSGALLSGTQLDVVVAGSHVDGAGSFIEWSAQLVGTVNDAAAPLAMRVERIGPNRSLAWEGAPTRLVLAPRNEADHAPLTVTATLDPAPGRATMPSGTVPPPRGNQSPAPEDPGPHPDPAQPPVPANAQPIDLTLTVTCLVTTTTAN